MKKYYNEYKKTSPDSSGEVYAFRGIAHVLPSSNILKICRMDCLLYMNSIKQLLQKYLDLLSLPVLTFPQIGHFIRIPPMIKEIVLLNTYGSHYYIYMIIIEEKKKNGKKIFRITKDFRFLQQAYLPFPQEHKLILYALKTGIMHKDYYIFIYYNYTTLLYRFAYCSIQKNKGGKGVERWKGNLFKYI